MRFLFYKIYYTLILFFLFNGKVCANIGYSPFREDIPSKDSLMQLPFREIVERYYSDFYLGTANHARLLNELSGEIMDREFAYVTPSNDFKQSYIHPTFNIWRWENTEIWIPHCKKNNQLLRMHSPISPQASKWVKEDKRTPEELSRMMDEYLITLCRKFNGHPNILWMDVVNETIAPTAISDPLGNLQPGDWFGPRRGIDKWENPWTILGFDESSELRVPRYIDRAFELTNQYAPDIRQIINQHGALEEVVWAKMRQLVTYLRHVKGRKIDGLGWQAHIDVGWEKIPGNLDRLDKIIKWCHTNHLEFHITEMNVWLKDGDLSRQDEQAQTFRVVLSVLLKNRKTGVVGLNFWNVRDEDTANPNWYGTLWDNQGNPKPAYYQIKEELIEQILK